jgi:hypothetical protein
MAAVTKQGRENNPEQSGKNGESSSQDNISYSRDDRPKH